MKKRLLSLFLVAFLILTDIAPVITVAAEELGTPDPVLVQQEFTVSAEDDGVTNAELYNYYAQRLFDEALGIESPSVWSTSVLQEGTLEKELYDAVVPELKKIAAGTMTSASITVNPSKTWTKEDLGVTGEFISGSSLTPEANAGIGEKLNLIYNCLLADCPLELYWHDKVRVGEVGGVEFGMSGISPSGDGLSFGSIIFNFTVAADYRPVDAANVFTTDATKTGAASAAVAYAETIVAANASKSNLEKLAAYKDAICELVSYDSAAADSSIAVAGVDHWQMVYVFDQNAETNVVCEGYAKAFQYLCDLSTFTGGVECHTLTGVMTGGTGAGGHMWNVVTMDDGKNYLVDVTNCDSGTIGAPDKLFIAHTANSADANRTHTFAVGGSSISFTYDAEMEDLFCDGYLPIATTVYSPPPEGNVRTTPIDTWEFNTDTSGEGWSWDHETKTLTLTDLTIDCSEYYVGISLVDGATLVSAGSGNKISSCEDGIGFYGDLTITGSAPLTVDAPYAVYDYATSNTTVTVDGVPMVWRSEECLFYVNNKASADHALILNGGSYIATEDVALHFDGYGYSFVKGDPADEVEPTEVEFAVSSDPCIDLTAIPAEEYAGKANDGTMSVTLTVGAVVVGSSDPLTYQWYSCDDYNGANPVAVAGATSASYTFSGSKTADSYYFFCRATAGTLTRDFPVSKVVLTASGTLPVENDLHLYYDDPTIDRLNTYGYKWEPSTLTLTLKNADIRGQLSIYADSENPGDITIKLVEGSVNSVTRESQYGVLYGSGNYNSDFIITGAGTLNVSRSGSGSSTYGVVSNGGETLIISGRAQVNVNNSRPMSVVKCTVNTPVLQVCDTAKLTVSNTTPDVDVADRAYAVGNYNVLKATKITTPADYTTEVSGNVTFVKDAAGYATKVVFERDTAVRIDFEQYPQTSISTPYGQNTALTASAVLYNYAEAYTVAYQWYLDGEAIVGATSANYTFAPTEVDTYTLRCDASVTAGGKDYAITGEDITVKYGFYTGSMSFSPSTASMDHLDTYGWKWDNATATLTLNGAYIDNGSTGLKISGFTAEKPFKIVLAEGGRNIIYGGSTVYAMDISDYVLITGTGTLELRGTGLSSLYGRNGSHLTVAGGAQVVINHQTRANGSSSEPLNFTGSGVLWLEDEGTKLTVNPVDDKSCSLHIARFDSCKRAQMEHYFLLSGPANPQTDYRGYLCDGSKTYRGQLVLTANLTTRPIFNQYPMLKYSVEKNSAVTLTAGAKMLNYTGASPTISYQWYLGSEAIDGATNASYTFTPTEASVSGLRCDATITAGGNTYTLTGSSILVLCEAYEGQLILNDTTASVDKLDAYGYKWDKDTKTLTLDGFAQCSAGANASLNVMTDLTIVLAEGSVNTLNSSTEDGIFITNGKTLTITGNGKLIANSFAPAAADSHGLNMYSGSKIIVQNDAKLELNTLGLIGVDGAYNNSFVVSGKDSYISATAAEGGKAFYLNTPTIAEGDFVVKAPVGGKLFKNGSYVTSVDSTNSPVNHCVLKGDDTVYFNFAQYPATKHTLTKGNTLPLTATASLTNYDGSATISYQWYMNGEAIAGATAATYTFAPTVAGLYTLRCDAATTVDEMPYSVTGKDITVIYDVYPYQIALGDTTASVDNLEEYGWKWDKDTKTLTLDGLNQAVSDVTNSLYVNTDVTIVLAEGSVNTFSSAQSITLFIQSNASVTVTGKGTLRLSTSSTSREAIHLNPSAKLFVQGGATVEATTLASDCVVSAKDISIKVRDKGSSFSATAKTGGRAFALYQPAIDPGDFMVQTPAGGQIKNGTSVDSNGNNAAHCVLVPARWYVTASPEKIVTTSVGQTVKLTVGTKITDSTKLTYQWYTTEDYSSPVGDSTTKAILGATAASYSIKVTERGMQGYYFCVISDGKNTVETPVSAVIAAAAGKQPITEKIIVEETVDNLTTHGYKWDVDTKTLMLDDVEVYIPFSGNSTWFAVPAQCTIVLVEGSVNNVGKDSFGFSEDYALTVSGAGSLNMGSHLNSYDYKADLAFTNDAHVSLAYILINSDKVDGGGMLTVEDGAAVTALEDWSYIHGDITVDGGVLELDVLENESTTGSITVENGGKLVSNGSVYSYGPETTISENGEMIVRGNLTLGNSNSGKYTATRLTVGGKLLIDTGGVPLYLYTTLSGAEAIVFDGTKMHAPAEYSIINGTVDGEKQLRIGKQDESFYGGEVFIAPNDFQPIPLQSISLVGTPKYGERLDFVTVPADAIIGEYKFQYADSPNAPDDEWTNWSVGTSNYQDVSPSLVDRYVRVVATATATHTGTVTSHPIGPVIGDPSTLKNLYVDGAAWSNFSAGNYDYNGSIWIDSGDEVLYKHYRVVPVDDAAEVTMKVVNDLHPDGLDFTGTEAYIPLVMGANTVTVTVIYGEREYEYTINYGVYLNSGYFYLTNVAADTVITADVDYSDLSGKTDETLVINSASNGAIHSMPYDTVITLTATTPAGKRLWCYGDNALLSDGEENNTCTYTFGKHTNYVFVDDSDLIAVAPEVGAVYWNSFVDIDGTSSAVIYVETLEREPNSYNYYDITITTIDNETGEVVGDPYSTEEAGVGPGAGEAAVRCVIDDLDPNKDYTFKICYSELVNAHSDIPEEIAQTQYAVTTLESISLADVALIPSTDHIILKPGQTAEITFTADGFNGGFVELMDSTDDDVVDPFNDYAPDGAKGVITAGSEGTTWLTFGTLVQTIYGADSRYAYTTVRVDVSNEEDPTTHYLNLGTTSGILNLFDDSTLTVPVYNMDCGYRILGASFVDDAMGEVFDIEAIGARAIKIVPKGKDPMDTRTFAQWGKDLSGTYNSAIRVAYRADDGTVFHTSEETLTIKLSAKAPSVKATAVKLNSFFINPTAELVFTTKDGVVAEVKVDESKATDKAPACPDWLTLNGDMTVTLDNSLLSNKGSGKLNVEVWLEGFRAPAQVAVSISAAYTAPKLKLSATTVNLVADYTKQDSILMQLLPSDKKVNFADLGITDIRAANASDLAIMSEKDRKTYAASLAIETSNFDEKTGEFYLYTDAEPVNGKAALVVTFDGNDAQTVIVPVTVKVVPLPTLKASTTKVTLNPIFGVGEDEKVVTLSASAQGFMLSSSNVHCAVTDSKGNDADDLLSVVKNGAELIIATADEDIPDGSYKVSVTADGAADKAVVITVTVKTAVPKMKLSASSVTINRVMGKFEDEQSVTVTGADSSYEVELNDDSITVLDPAGRDVTDEDHLYCYPRVVDGKETIIVSPHNHALVGTYKVVITDTDLPSVSATISVKVVDKYPSVKANPSSITLLKGTTFSEQTVTFTGLDGYDLYSTTSTVNGNFLSTYGLWNSSLGSDNTMTFSCSGNPEPGSYKVSVTPTFAYYGCGEGYHEQDKLEGKPITVTIKVVESVSATASVKSTLDVTRPETGTAPFTFKWNGWSPAEYAGMESPVLEWRVYALNGKVPVTEGIIGSDGLVANGECYSSDNEAGNGWFRNISTDMYGVNLVLNENELVNINPKYTYNVVFTLRFRDGMQPLDMKAVKMTVKQGGVKFAADAKDVTLSKWDSYDRAIIDLYSTDKDAANVANIAKVAVSSDLFKVEKTLSGKYAIVWKDNTIPATAKSGTIKLNIWLEGNYVDGCENITNTKDADYRKPNATVSLKVNVK